MAGGGFSGGDAAASADPGGGLSQGDAAAPVGAEGRDRDAARRRRSRPTRTGEPAPTIIDVADRAGVSTATVSRVLSGSKAVRPETERRVLAAVDALGYRPSGPARALAGSRTRTLGLIMTDLSQAFYPELSRAVESAAQARGYTMILANGAGDSLREAGYLDLLAERRVDGILVASWGITARHIDWLVRAPVEVVLLTCRAPGVPLPAILAASRQGARLAVEHLVALGHRRLGEIAGPAESAATSERRAGVLDAIAATGLPAGSVAVAHSRGDFASGETAAAALLAATPRPTGLICYNDLVAAGALKAARAAGLSVPGDLSVVGFDDVPLAAMLEPPLTTVAQPVAEMATWAVERISERIEAFDRGEPPPGPEVVEMGCRLVVRSSTTEAPA